MSVTSDGRTEPLHVLDELTRRFDDLTGSQKRIVEYIVRNPDKVAFMNLDKLADAITVSPSTIVRLCYRLGYEGFTDMQGELHNWLRAQLHREGQTPATGSENDKSLPLFYQSMDHDMRNLQETRRMITPDLIERAVTILLEARMIYVIGLRSAYAPAHALALGINKVIGNAVFLSAAQDGLLDQIQGLTVRDVVVAVTFPRYSSLTLDVARYGKERGAKVLGITDSMISPVARVADVVLPCAYQGLGGVQNSLTAPLSVVHGLISMVEAAKWDEYQERLKSAEELSTRWNLILLRQKD